MIDTMEAHMSHFLSALAARAKEAPGAIAVEDGRVAWTYRELHARANGLAHQLRHRGIGPEQSVAILAERSFETLVAVVATLKAGGAYVPLDPAAPAPRCAAIVHDSRARLALASRTAGLKLPGVLTIDPASASPSDLEPTPIFHPRSAAYVIFTSGSTGEPKGIVVEHRNLDNFVRWAVEFFDVRPSDRFLQFAPLIFDGHVWEIFPPLAAGARIRLLPDGAAAHDVGSLRDLLSSAGITHVDIPASLLASMTPPPASKLRVCMTGSEPVSAGAVRNWWSPEYLLVNGYGPTEATDLSHAAICEPTDERPPLGSAVEGCHGYVLTEALELVNPGAVGELYIGGLGVARGYLGRPGLTAERFIPDPYVAGARMYRTGDRVEVASDGALRYVGRTDEQVQVAGHRVEPAEVEAAVCRCPGVRDAIVVPSRGGQRERLAAFVIGAPNGLREQLRDALPAYMVPHAIIGVNELPRLPSGKVDRRQLSARADALNGASVAANGRRDQSTPAGGRDTQATVLACISEVLGRHVSPGDSFVALGGDSLDAMRVAASLRGRAGVRVTVAALLGDVPLERIYQAEDLNA